MRKLAIVLVALLSPMAANADLIYAPGGADTTEGDRDNCIPLSGCFAPDDGIDRSIDRYQQVYDASLFSGFSGPMAISDIAFRLNFGSADASGAYSDLRVNLSTTSASSTSYSLVFADNYGADVTTVFDGAFSWTATSGGNPNAFDFLLTFDNPFVYDPLAGNLLFEWQNFGSDDTAAQFDAARFAPMSRIYAKGGGASATNASGSTSRYGLVTRFTATAVPEPGTLALFGIGLFGVAFMRRRQTTKYRLSQVA